MSHYAPDPKLDDYDRGILHERERAYRAGHLNAPRVGDWVEFPDLDKMRRISHIWTDEDGNPESIQTSDGGSFYIGSGYVSFSGSLFSSVPASSLHPTWNTHEGISLGQVMKDGSVWFFHHDWQERDNGVNATIKFRVFHCEQNAPKS